MRDDRDGRYDREMRYGRRGRQRDDEEWLGRGEYGAAYEAPYRGGFHGYGMGYRGGALRSRGSYEAGQLRSGLNPVDEFEFEWGGGYVGGRGYGGTNYDYQHGYQTGGFDVRATPLPGTQRRRGRQTSPATRGGFSWSEYEQPRAEPRGPARYGYGPYHERLLRRRRSDEEIRADVEETLFYDTWVDADRIQVEVEDGVVTLKGTLPNFDEVRYATEDAWDVDGVRGVRTLLEVDEFGRESEGTAEAGATGEAEALAGGRGSGAAAGARRAEPPAEASERGGAAEMSEPTRSAGEGGQAGEARAEASGTESTTRARAAERKEGSASGSRSRRSTSSKQKSKKDED